MKDLSSTFAFILIIGTIKSVFGVQPHDINDQSGITNSDYLKFHSSPSFGNIARENNGKASTILSYGVGDFTKTSGYNSKNYEGTTKVNEMNTGPGYRSDMGNRNYGFNTKLILMVSQPVPKYPNLHRTETNYSNKSPIQILPSRFPPPLEKLIQNIQNYFSTYNHPDLQNKPYTPQSPQVATNTEEEINSGHPTEATTEIKEETTTEEAVESTITALYEN